MWLLTIVFCQAVAAPITIPPPEALKFMQRFGYLDRGLPDSEALYNEEAVIEAIKNVQTFGGIEQTGELDNATMKLMASPRCGVPDIPSNKTRQKRYIVGADGWNKRDITYFIANWSPKLGQATVETELRRAFDAWSGYARLNFYQVQDPNADIIIAFGRGYHGDIYPFDGQGNILAHAYFPYEMGNYGGDMHFDEDEPWKSRPTENEEGVDFFTVAVHELGHSLGLSHSPVQSSIMFPYYKGYESHFQLDYDDILGMYELYIARNIEGTFHSRQEAPTTGNGNEEEEENVDDHDNDESGNESVGDNESESEDAEVKTSSTATTSLQPTTPYPTTSSTTTSRANFTFEGDYETVDEHRKHMTTHLNAITTTNHPPPDPCEGHYDVVAFLRGELFILKGKFLWRLSQRAIIQPGYPIPFTDFFWKLPKNITTIDSIYERHSDGSIVIFTGKKFWVYDGQSFIENSPQSLTSFGLPENVEKIDASFIWDKNGKLFLFSEDRYWRLNEITRVIDPGYPQNISRWRGVPSNLDSAITWSDGQTYFFKNDSYWRFNNILIKTDDQYPLSASEDWFGCANKKVSRSHHKSNS